MVLLMYIITYKTDKSYLKTNKKKKLYNIFVLNFGINRGRWRVTQKIMEKSNF